MLFMIGYLVSVSIASIPGVPDSLWVRVMSYVPFWSPTLMLMRIGVGRRGMPGVANVHDGLTVRSAAA